ncbi:MAG: hypothetical protein WC450_08665 [Candidatus Omnitrophota bacterium]|jgi:uncharacterized protein YdaU (DUF1376 family)
MAKDPAFLFYTSDFLTGTMTMTDEQVGKYIRLLCMQHQKGTLTKKDMLFICRTYDNEVFSKFQENSDGTFFNKRLLAETEKRVKYSQSRAFNRSNKDKDMKNISSTYDKDMKKICNRYDEHMENENENININIKDSNKSVREEEDYSDDFLSFWKAYPKKSGSKKAAFDVWKKLGTGLPSVDIILSSIMIHKGWRKNANGEFRPEWKDPERWLKSRMWESDFEAEAKKAIGVPRDDFAKCGKCGTRMFKGDLNKAGLCMKCEDK